jgi:hypothetical protein
MKKFTVMATVMAMSAAFSVTAVPASAADACRNACNQGYQQCSKNKDPQACLPSWGQCKAKCKRATGSVSAKNTTAVKPVQSARR